MVEESEGDNYSGTVGRKELFIAERKSGCPNRGYGDKGGGKAKEGDCGGRKGEATKA